MKKVFSNSDQVIHLFANQLQDEATNTSRNVFFNGRKIYSYGHHYLLGEFIDHNTILINDSGYSVTTSKHISQLKNATNHKKHFFTTETDLKLVLQSIRFNVKKLQRANKPELYILPSLILFSKLNEFIEYTKDKAKKKTIEYKEIEFLISAINSDPKNSIDSLNKFEIKRAKTEKRLKNAQFKNQIKLFKTHKINRLNIYVHDLLRISSDGNNIETSQGIKIDILQAKRLLKLIDNKKIIGAKVNDTYTITAFNGFLKSGCHNIPLSEINFIKNLI